MGWDTMKETTFSCDSCFNQRSWIHILSTFMLELGGTRVDVSVMTPLKPWDFFGEKWLTNQATFSKKKEEMTTSWWFTRSESHCRLDSFWVDVTWMLLSCTQSWFPFLDSLRDVHKKETKVETLEMLQLLSLDTTQCTDPEPPKQLIEFSASHQKNFQTVLLNLRASMKTEAAKICGTPRISLFDLRIGTPRTGPHWLNFEDGSHMLELQNVLQSAFVWSNDATLALKPELVLPKRHRVFPIENIPLSAHRIDVLSNRSSREPRQDLPF